MVPNRCPNHRVAESECTLLSSSASRSKRERDSLQKEKLYLHLTPIVMDLHIESLPGFAVFNDSNEETFRTAGLSPLHPASICCHPLELEFFELFNKFHSD